MLIRTHLVVTLFFVLLILPFVSYKALFIILALIVTFIPDVDIEHSKLGKKKIFRPLQFFVSHRGFFHSFTFLFLMTFVFVLFIPILALGFFVGYASHLFADSLTPIGIKPFWPFKKKISGRIHTGGKWENFIFILFLIIDVVLMFRYIFTI